MSGTPHVEPEGHWIMSGIAVSVNMGFVIGSWKREHIYSLIKRHFVQIKQRENDVKKYVNLQQLKRLV